MITVAGRAGRRTRPGRLLVVAVAMVAACAACATSTPSTTSSSTAGALGVTIFDGSARKPLPDLRASTLSGTHVQLRSFVGHGVVVLNVWASWCTECRSESPTLAALARQFNGRGVSFVGVDEQDTASKAKSFARSTGMSYPHLVDPDGSLLSRLQVLPSYGLPSTLFVDAHGNMAARIIGAASAAQVRALVARLRQ